MGSRGSTVLRILSTWSFHWELFGVFTGSSWAKDILIFICFSMLCWIAFLSIFDANLAPTCVRKSMKIREKSMPRAIPILHSFFDRFLIDFCSIFRSLKPHFLLKLYWFYNIFLLLRLLNIRSMFEYIFDATWLGLIDVG